MLLLKDHKVFIKLRNVACRHNELPKLSIHYLLRVQRIINTFRADSYRTVPTELMVENASTLNMPVTVYGCRRLNWGIKETYKPTYRKYEA